ncbi:MAG: hypothetical protein ACREIF_12915 [Chthoniobacterales bacterium]
MGWIIVAVVAVSFVQSVLALPPGSITRHASHWPVFAAHEEGLTMERFVPHGRILTLAPIFPLEGGLEIYPAFATGPFAWRTARFIDTQRRARFGFMAPADLAAFLKQQPPDAIFTGAEHAEIEEPIKRYVGTHHYLAHRLRDRGLLQLATSRQNRRIAANYRRLESESDADDQGGVASKRLNGSRRLPHSDGSLTVRQFN